MIMVTQNPNIYWLDAAYDVKNIQKTAKEKLADVSEYQEILKQLEVNVALNETERNKNKLRIVSYATDANRWGNVDKGDGTWAHRLWSKKLYESLAAMLKDAPGYLPPSEKEAKVFYDIWFRLKQLWFDTNSKGEKLQFTADYTNDMAIAIMAFQKMSWANKIEAIVGPETFRKLLQGDTKVSLLPVQSSSLSSAPASEPMSQTDNEQATDIIPGNDAGNDTSVTDIKTFTQNYSLSNTLDNITKEELNIFDKLDRQINKNDKLYAQFERDIVSRIEKTYAWSKVKTFEGNITQNVSELLRNYSEWYLDQNTPEQKEIEVDPKFFLAIKDTIVEWLSSSARSKEEKQWLVLFVKWFTSNFNDILQSYQKDF